MYDELDGVTDVTFQIVGRVMKSISLATFMIPSFRWLVYTIRKIYLDSTSSTKETFRDSTLPGDDLVLSSI